MASLLVYVIIVFILCLLITYLIVKLSVKEKFYQKVEFEKNELENKHKNLYDDYHRVLRDNQVLENSLEHSKKQIHDWEATKEESLKIAKETMFETGSEFFKRETEEFNKKTENSFKNVVESLSTLKHRIYKQENTVETIWRSLSTPSTIGKFSEIGLENTLKNYGLEPNKDFFMQYSINSENIGLRPDAVVFLPGDKVLIIDSKASIYFLELAKCDEGDSNYQENLKNIKLRMNEHLRSLSSKKYKDAIKDHVKEKGLEVSHIITVLFIQTEAAIESLVTADPEFRQKANKEDIIIAGPTGLSAIFSIAKYEINNEKQIINHQKIISEISNLLYSIGTITDYAKSISKSFLKSVDSIQKFNSSINKSILPKARRLVKMGVTVPKNKEIPESLPSIYVASEKSQLIEEDVISDEK